MSDVDPSLRSYDSRPGVLVFADTDAARDRAIDGVTMAGLRLGGAVPLADAMARLDAQAGIDAVLVEVDGQGGAVLDRLLDRLAGLAETGRSGLVVSLPPGLIDRVDLRLWDTDTSLLLDPDAFERVAALHSAVRGVTSRAHDIDTDTSPLRLRQLSDEVARIAQALAAMSAQEARRSADPARPLEGASEDEEPVTADQVRAVIRSRRLRLQLFEPELFSDPAWDMLLDLMAARIEGKPVAVSSLCIAAVVPPTTALRWIKTMTDNGVFVRRSDPTDGRRVFITLSETAAIAMDRYMIQMRRMLRDAF